MQRLPQGGIGAPHQRGAEQAGQHQVDTAAEHERQGQDREAPRHARAREQTRGDRDLQEERNDGRKTVELAEEAREGLVGDVHLLGGFLEGVVDDVRGEGGNADDEGHCSQVLVGANDLETVPELHGLLVGCGRRPRLGEKALQEADHGDDPDE